MTAILPHETPIARVNRIGCEMAVALNDYADGTMHAVIYPSEKREFCVGFVISDLPAAEDPLIATIRAYESGIEDFRQNAPNDDPGADAYAKLSYEPPMQALEEWSNIARSPESVHAALKLAKRATKDGDHPLAASMITAAIGFYEGRR
jgi:hypothetical protein